MLMAHRSNWRCCPLVTRLKSPVILTVTIIRQLALSLRSTFALTMQDQVSFKKVDPCMQCVRRADPEGLSGRLILHSPPLNGEGFNPGNFVEFYIAEVSFSSFLEEENQLFLFIPIFSLSSPPEFANVCASISFHSVSIRSSTAPCPDVLTAQRYYSCQVVPHHAWRYGEVYSGKVKTVL